MPCMAWLASTEALKQCSPFHISEKDPHSRRCLEGHSGGEPGTGFVSESVGYSVGLCSVTCRAGLTCTSHVYTKRTLAWRGSCPITGNHQFQIRIQGGRKGGSKRGREGGKEGRGEGGEGGREGAKE